MEFSFKRVFYLLKGIYLSNGMMYALFSGCFSYMLLTYLMEEDSGMYLVEDGGLYSIYITMFFIALCLSSFSGFKIKNMKFFTLTKPVSALERFVAEFISTFIINNIILLAGMLLSVISIDLLLGSPEQVLTNINILLNDLNPKTWSCLLIFALLFASALGFYFSLRFGIYGAFVLIGTLVAIGGALVGLKMLSPWKEATILDNMTQNLCFYDYYQVSGEIIYDGLCVILGIASLFFIVLTYFHLKEKEL